MTDGVDVGARASGSDDDLALGVVGVSEGNGHPYSFASIVNGYSDAGFAATEWGVIHDYLREKDPSEFGFPGVSVTHAWTQDPDETERLCTAARIPNAAPDLSDLRDADLDGVVVARDDYEAHHEMCLPFLEAGVPVFVDKPLSLDVDELRSLRPSLERGLLMSCSGMRYARELDGPRSDLDAYGTVRLVRGAVLFDWERYGVHLVDAIMGMLDARPLAVRATTGTDGHDSMTVEMDDGTLVQIDALGEVPLTFDVDVYGSERTSHHELRDNFRAFRRTLWRFVEMVRSGVPAIPPEATLDVMRVLIAGQRSRRDRRRVEIDEIDI